MKELTVKIDMFNKQHLCNTVSFFNYGGVLCEY